MLKKGIFGMGLAGFAVLCMLMNASGNIVYMTSFDKDSGKLPNWTIYTDIKNVGSVIADNGNPFSVQKSTYISSPKDRATKAWATSPDLPSGYGNSPYVLEVYVYLPDTNNHWFYVMCNGQIRSVVDQDNKLVYRHDDINEKLMTLSTGKWYRLFYDVHLNGDKDCTTPHVHINVATGSSTWYYGPYNLYQNTYWTNLYFGDDESTTANFGTAYIDDVRVNDDIFFADFNSGDHIGWKWETTAGDYAKIYITSNKAASDTGKYSMRVDSPKTESMAWAYTPYINVKLDKPYTVSMNFYLDTYVMGGFFLAYNGHTWCYLVGDYSVPCVNLYSISGSTATKVASLPIWKWMYLRMDVRPADQKYDIYIGNCGDDNGPQYKTTVGFYSKDAINYLGMGDPDTSSSTGTAYFDNVRVEGTPK